MTTTSAAVLASRLDRVLSAIRPQGAAGLVTPIPENVAYLTGFIAAAYTRPILFVASPTPLLVVPELELEHARMVWPGEIRAYSDDAVDTVAGRTHLQIALQTVAEVVKALGFSPVAYERHGLCCAGAEIVHAMFPDAVSVGSVVETLRMQKDAEELAIMRRTGRLIGEVMARHLARSRPGATEVGLQYAATAEAAAGFPSDGSDIEVWSRPIAGPRTAFPHARPTTRPLRLGDVVIHSLGLRMAGYWTGLERTCILGNADGPTKRAFMTMYEAQARAIDAIRPGATAMSVHAAACRGIEDAGYLISHRTGHGIGLGVHEPPSVGARVEPGMVLSIEPGIYLPGLGGFRHADNVVVTEEGGELVSEFPRNLDSMLLDVD